MKRFILKFTIVLLLSLPLSFINVSMANNIVVSNVSLTGQNVADNYTMVRFDISWENSWRTSSAPNNWDAAWIFVKYRVGSGNWMHASLRGSGHIAPEGASITAPDDNTGLFLYRSSDGSGPFTSTGVKIRWDYGLDGVGNTDIVDVKVIAIEMVYVPQGSFYIGSGGGETSHLYTFPTSASPYFVNNEAEIAVGPVDGNLYYLSSATSGDGLGPVPTTFPKGTNPMYVMKYEISQQAYVDFLNLLTRAQQNTRTSALLASGVTSVTNRYVMVTTDAGSNGSTTPLARSGIRCDAVIHPTNPITFYCDLNMNDVPNESDDGQHIACVYLSWADAMAYLDWVGLRPMTELEFEKACRGSLTPVANEYAWGSASIVQNTGLSFSGQAGEISSVSNANCTYGNGIPGPGRTGMFAKAATSRVASGATYYGILDMSGNLWERPVTIGNPQGRTFTGLHGNGIITVAGNADVTNWPGTDGLGSGFRAGYWNSAPVIIRMSDRSDGAHGTDRRRDRFGGRGIRSAP